MELVISSKKHGKYTILIDDEDYPLIAKYTWHVEIRKNKTPRVSTTVGKPSTGQTVVMMHRMLMSPGEKHVDHINGNGLDNRRSNLRLCSCTENNRNQPKRAGAKTSKYKGVRFNARAKKFEAYIRVNKKTLRLGAFHNENLAGLAYNTAAEKHFGEFARLNIVE
jgi:hypothetical protein